MPNLLIGIVENDWCIQIANVPGWKYDFQGYGDLDTQVAFVEGFATSMKNNEGAVKAVQGFIDLGDANAETIATQVFGTDGVVLQGKPIWSCVGEDTLLDDIVDVGRAILEFL